MGLLLPEPRQYGQDHGQGVASTPRGPLSKIAQGAFEIDACPEPDCDYTVTSYAGFVIHMWNVHKEDVRDRGEK